MIRKTRPAARNLAIAFAALLPALTHGTCAAANRSAASTSPPVASQQSAQPTQELEEIWAYGKSLVVRISAAQNDFYLMYNKANEKDEYDIKCDESPKLHSENMLMIRICLPALLNRRNPVSLPENTGMCFSPQRDVVEYGGNFHSTEYRIGQCIDLPYEPPRSSFVSKARITGFQKHMSEVISADPHLVKKAADLDDLNMELESVQQRFRTIKGIQVKMPAIPKPVKVIGISRD